MDASFPSLPDELAAGIVFTADGVDLPDFSHARYSRWLQSCATNREHSITSLGYIFVSDDALLEMNIEHLDHDTLTDIITFDLRDSSSSIIDGECYISLDRVKDNASRFNVSVLHELKRVLVHGLLHLCGLGDKTEREAIEMREAEDFCLSLFSD